MIKIKACNHCKKWLRAYFFLQSIKIFKMNNLSSECRKSIVNKNKYVMNNLYKVQTKNFNEFFVVAENFQKAVDYLEKVLNTNEYGFSSDRTVTNIELIATEDIQNDRQYFFSSSVGHLLIDK